jgi:outer membrane protein TolC
MIQSPTLPVVQRTFIFLAAVTVTMLAGCTREWYRADADRQVGEILAERKNATLGYQPQTVTETPPEPPKVTRKAYERLPLTVQPVVEPAPITPSRVIVPFAPLGPEMHLPPGSSAPDPDNVQESTVPVRRAPGRLVLGPPAPNDRVVKLDLFNSLEYAVQHSREYRSQMEQLYLAALDVTLERHLFAPRPFANASYIYGGGQADVNYRSALTATAQAGVRQRLPYGGEIVASGLVQFVDALNETTADGESAQVALSGSIPLLRGAGLVNLENLINSERQLVYAVRDFEDFRRSFAVDVAGQYFTILTAQQSVINRRTNFRNLSMLLERSEALYQAGRLNFLQVQVSGAQLYRAEAALIAAEARLENTLDDFKLLIGMDIETDLQMVPSALDVAVPDIENRDVIATAHKFRLDLQTRRDIVEDAARQVKVAANGLLPDLDIVADGRIGNPDDTSARRIGSRTAEYSAGVQLDLPVDRVAERNVYRRALINLDRARRDLEQRKEVVAADVLTRIRAIRQAEATVAIQTRSVELAQRRLEYANELLVTGKTTDARNVTDAQQDLLTAQDNYEDARATLQVEILRFLRDTGTLRVDPKAGALGRALDRAASDVMPSPQDLKSQ